MDKIYRLHYRAQFKESYTEHDLAQAIEECRKNIRKLQEDGRALTVALYRHDKMLFLYYEALGEAVKVVEPIALTSQTGVQAEAAKQNEMNRESIGDIVVESGEDVQVTTVHPTEFLAPLAPYLCVWPGQQTDRLWVHMYYIYCHNMPESKEQWKRAAVPEMRRGRIAFLRDEKLFSYVYYHKAIVDEGLLEGDKYQSIALHENILFSYFEEPKTFVNMRNSKEESAVIEEWLAVDPESHFIHMPQGQGENFMFLPALFAMGIEDLSE